MAYGLAYHFTLQIEITVQAHSSLLWIEVENKHITQAYTKKEELSLLSLLSHKDSNLNKQDQNLLCYHYTMRQYSVNLGGLEPPTPTLSR